MTSTGQLPEPWKSTAAALFNPYLNLNQISNPARQQSIRTRVLTPNRHVRVPTETILDSDLFKTPSAELIKRPKSKQFPNPNAAEEVSVYVQQMIHNQFCGRSGTPSDKRYQPQQQQISTQTNNNLSENKITPRKRIPSSKKQSRVSDYELDEFFNTADEQMSRMASMMPGRESSFSDYQYSNEQSLRHKTNSGQRLTLADMCNIASTVGDKMSQSKEKVGLDAIRGFRLPSAKLSYEPYEHHPIDTTFLLGQNTVNDPIHLNDILTDDNYLHDPLIEIVPNEQFDDRTTRASRTHSRSRTSNQSKMNEYKDWRGKISQPNLPDVRSESQRQYSASAISPQRPCTAASSLPKSRPESSGITLNQHQKQEEQQQQQQQQMENPSSSSINVTSTNVSSVLKHPSSVKQRQRNYPLNVRINENIKTEDHNQNRIVIDPPALSLPSETTEERLRTIEINPRSTPDGLLSSSTTPVNGYLQQSNDQIVNKKPYKLIESKSPQIYRTTSQLNPNENSNETNQQFKELTLSQLELLENYDPAVSARIGAPFIPVQMLSRPKDAFISTKRSIREIEKDYPKKKGQPVFEIRRTRSSNNIIDIAQTLQLTKSKRIPVQRQTTFEKPINESSIQDTIIIKSFDEQNKLALALYTSPQQQSLVKRSTSTRTSVKRHQNYNDFNSNSPQYLEQQNNSIQQKKEEDRMEYNLSVLNIRTQQEVDQKRRRDKPNPKRILFPTAVVTNANLSLPPQRNTKPKERSRSSVFITQDPDEHHSTTTTYHQAKSDVDIKRIFKGFITENLRKKLSAEERKKREEQQKAAIKIQRAYREHLRRKQQIATRPLSTSTIREQERQHRRILSAKRAQFVEQQLNEQTRIREENKKYKKMLDDTGPSVQIFANFNDLDQQFSKSTLSRAATCIQRWWRGFIIRHRLNHFKKEVVNSGLTWTSFSSRYRGVIERMQKIRHSDYKLFILDLKQAKDFLTFEKKLNTIYNTFSYNEKLDENELEKFFEACDLSATPYEIEQALDAVLQHHQHNKNEALTKDIVYDVIYYIYPPSATGLQTSRKSTWVRPIVDGEDETAIQGTPYLEPIDLDVVYKFLAQD